ncbi:MAG: IS110 family transposase [Bryobacteraceae bacterium]
MLVNEPGKQREVRKKEFRTYWSDLQKLKLWLYASKVEQVAMESTGVYWKPVWNVLEGHFPLLLANPYHMRNIPGQKTDQKDCEWISDLLAHGLLKRSFVPERPVQELRDLTRYRTKLTGEHNRIHGRIAKIMEDANVKLGSVASDILGVTGRRIIKAIIAGQEHPDWLADKACGTLRAKRDQLRLVLKGRITDHHRYMLSELMADLDRIEAKILRLETEIANRMKPHADVIERLMTIPGLKLITAWTIIAEMGTDMAPFPDAAHAASWAGLAPGNNQSGGKRRSGRTNKGNRWLRRALVQSAWAVSHRSNCFLTAQFYRRAARRGEKKAIIATAHQLLVIAFHILRDGTVYREKGGDYFDQLNPERTKQKLIARLERLGFDVILGNSTHPVPSPSVPPPSPRRRGCPCKCVERGINCKHSQ